MICVAINTIKPFLNAKTKFVFTTYFKTAVYKDVKLKTKKFIKHDSLINLLLISYGN